MPTSHSVLTQTIRHLHTVCTHNQALTQTHEVNMKQPPKKGSFPISWPSLAISNYDFSLFPLLLFFLLLLF